MERKKFFSLLFTIGLAVSASYGIIYFIEAYDLLDKYDWLQQINNFLKYLSLNLSISKFAILVAILSVFFYCSGLTMVIKNILGKITVKVIGYTILIAFIVLIIVVIGGFLSLL